MIQGKNVGTRFIFLTGFLLLAGCSQQFQVDLAALNGAKNLASGSDPSTCGGTFSETLQYQPGKTGLTKSNIVFVVDTSRSMTTEADQVAQNLLSFTQGITTQLSGENTRFAIIGKGTYDVPLPLAPTFEPGQLRNQVYWHSWGVGSTDKLNKAASAYLLFGAGWSWQNPGIPGLDIRAGSSCNETNLFSCNALNHLIFITDDGEKYSVPQEGQYPAVYSNEEAATVFETAFADHLRKTNSSFRAHAIYFKSNSVANSDCQKGERAQSTYRTYDKLIADTGGLGLDLCQSDWGSLFDALKDNIIHSASSFAIKSCPAVKKSVVSLTAQQGSLSVLLAPGEYQFMQLASGASLHVAPAVLESKGFRLEPAAEPIKVSVVFKAQ